MAHRIALLVSNDSERRALGSLVSSYGFAAHMFTDVNSAFASRIRFDLILIDYVLGHASLLDLIARLDRGSGTHYVPVLVLIDSWQVTDAVPWINDGVDEFVFRPIQEAILYARLRALLRLGEFHERVRRQNVQLRREMEMARSIQQNLMVNRFPQVGRYSIAARYTPATDLWGVFFVVCSVSGSLFGLFIADVPGHGLQAALLSMIVKGALDAIKKQHYSPASLLGELNTRLVPLFEPLNTFITAFSAIIDVWTGRLLYCSAGHPVQFLFHGGQAQGLKTRGGILGLSTSRQFSESMADLSQGDILLLYTDGLVEASSEDGEAFGEQRLIHCAQANLDQEPETIVGALVERLDEFAAPASEESALHDDDVNIIVVKAQY